MTIENKLAISKAMEKARLMYQDFSALGKILEYDGKQDNKIELSNYIERMENAKSASTKAKWYYEIITTFHAASAILHNGKHFYNCMVTEIDMEDLKKYLQERAKELLQRKVTQSSWAGQVRTATLKILDLEELI